MRKVVVSEESLIKTYDASEMYETFSEEGRAVYAKVADTYPELDVIAAGDTSEEGYAVGDVVLLTEIDCYGYVIWLNDGDSMVFERADTCLRFVSLGENETITISPN